MNRGLTAGMIRYDSKCSRAALSSSLKPKWTSIESSIVTFIHDPSFRNKMCLHFLVAFRAMPSWWPQSQCFGLLPRLGQFCSKTPSESPHNGVRYKDAVAVCSMAGDARTFCILPHLAHTVVSRERSWRCPCMLKKSEWASLNITEVTGQQCGVFFERQSADGLTSLASGGRAAMRNHPWIRYARTSGAGATLLKSVS